jgi:cytochrome P450
MWRSEYYKIVTHEICSVFSSSTEIQNGAQLSSCKYLRACIDEALQLVPPAVFTLWREQADDASDKSVTIIDGHVIPRGTQVDVNLYLFYHNGECFPEPSAFQPER